MKYQILTDQEEWKCSESETIEWGVMTFYEKTCYYRPIPEE